MKLPRPSTRRYRVLRAFVGKSLTLDELITAFGLFGFEWRSSLLTELDLLRRSGYLRLHGHRYSLATAYEHEFLAAGAQVAEIVPPREFNKLSCPPLRLERLHDASMRRPNCLSVEITRHFTASDAVPFSDDYEPEPRTQIPQPEDDGSEL